MTELFLNREKYQKIAKNCGVYCILNKLNDKFYIGSSKNIKNRFASHKSTLRTNKHKNMHLQNAWNKYGEENFSFYVIERNHDVNILLDREKNLIRLLKPQYNLSNVQNNKFVLSEETKKKIGEKSRKKFLDNPALIEKFKLAVKPFIGGNRGKKMSTEQRRKLSESAKKRGCPQLFSKSSIEKRNKNRYKKRVCAFGENFYMEFNSIKEAAKYFNGNDGNIITGIQKNRVRYGFYWKYI